MVKHYFFELSKFQRSKHHEAPLGKADWFATSKLESIQVRMR